MSSSTEAKQRILKELLDEGIITAEEYRNLVYYAMSDKDMVSPEHERLINEVARRPGGMKARSSIENPDISAAGEFKNKRTNSSHQILCDSGWDWGFEEAMEYAKRPLPIKGDKAI